MKIVILIVLIMLSILEISIKFIFELGLQIVTLI